MNTAPGVLNQIQRLFADGPRSGWADEQLLTAFIARRDDSAFGTLVARHGPMVLGTCRAVLRDANAAEDAFQATFLVLVRRARSIRGHESLAGWLHRVAYRVAVEANRSERRRRDEERTAGTSRALAYEPDEPNDDLRALIHAELERLPRSLRMPIVLCDLAGLSREEAAAALNSTEGSVRGRLARGRSKLRARLTQRGVALSAAALAAALNREASASALPKTWLDATTRMARIVLAADSFATATSAAILASRVVAMAASASRLRIGGVALAIVATALGVAGMVYGRADDADRTGMEKTPPAARVTAKPGGPAADETRILVRGRVSAPDGRAVANARVSLMPAMKFQQGMFQPAAPVRASTDREGRFQFEVQKSELARRTRSSFSSIVTAQMPGFGVGWVELDGDVAAAEYQIQLVRDDVPIIGRLVDLEGRPIAGATVFVCELYDPAGRLTAWLAELREDDGRMNPEFWTEKRHNALTLGGPGALPTTTTDADGRFRLTGVGRDRYVCVVALAPTISMAYAPLVTTDDPRYVPVPLPADGAVGTKLQGPKVTLVAPPGREVVGTVRDRDTNRPIPGVTVTTYTLGTGLTDAEGRYRLGGQPVTARVAIAAEAKDQPYLKVVKDVATGSSLGTVAIDLVLKRGVWAEGRVTSSAGGKPVDAVVEYFPFRDNPHLKQVADFAGLNNNVSDEAEYETDAEGNFRAAVLPGRGVLAVRASRPGFRLARRLSPAIAGNVLHAGNFEHQQNGYNALVPIDVPEKAARFVQSAVLDPGTTQKIVVKGADGQPITGTKAFHVDSPFWSPHPLSAAEVDVSHPEPGKARTVAFVHEGKRLGGFINVDGTEKGPLTVALRPTATAVGRLVDGDGHPRAGVDLVVIFVYRVHGDTMVAEHVKHPKKTDRNGQFRIEELVPGLSYEILVSSRGAGNSSGYLGKPYRTFKPGETNDLGDLRETPIHAPK
jgi:RNA polymerase sigma factor (sigma-70 family)